jgi:hypothetical protein
MTEALAYASGYDWKVFFVILFQSIPLPGGVGSWFCVVPKTSAWDDGDTEIADLDSFNSSYRLGGTTLSEAKGVALDQTTPIPSVWACHPSVEVGLVLWGKLGSRSHWTIP